MLGSLYFAEVANFVPCQLCWFQRIAMYPLAVILLVGALRRDWGVRWYAVPVAAIGAAISTYHVLLEQFPSLESSNVCSAAVPCNFVWFEELGFVTLPYMALSAFALILVLLTLPPAAVREDDDDLASQEAVA
jgi:disulfide bond formation protein DsbB